MSDVSGTESRRGSNETEISHRERRRRERQFATCDTLEKQAKLDPKAFLRRLEEQLLAEQSEDAKAIVWKTESRLELHVGAEQVGGLPTESTNAP